MLSRIYGERPKIKASTNKPKEKKKHGDIAIHAWNFKTFGSLTVFHNTQSGWVSGFNKDTRRYETFRLEVYVDGKLYYKSDEVIQVNFSFSFEEPAENFRMLDVSGNVLRAGFTGVVRIKETRYTEGLEITIDGTDWY